MNKDMGTFPKMIHYPIVRDPWFDRIYFEDMFKNCLQIQPNTDGSWDIYDLNTEKHLMHI